MKSNCTTEERAVAHLNGRKPIIESFASHEKLSKDAKRSILFHCYKDYKDGATEQKAIDHSEEHLNWIIKQYHLWSYEMCHCDNNEFCTFKDWIDKAMEE